MISQRLEALPAATADALRVASVIGARFSLATLGRAMEGLIAEDTPAARAGIEAFLRQVEALIEAGALEAADGCPGIETAAAIGALLPSAAGTELKRRRRQGTPLEGER